MIDADTLIRLFKLENPKIIVDNLMASCPFAKSKHASGKDTHRSFGIHLDTNSWNCFTCGEKGETIRSLAYRLRIQLPPEVMMDTLQELPKEKKSKVSTVGNYDRSLIKKALENSQEAYTDLEHRGIEYGAIVLCKIGKNMSTGSIVFPCFDDKNRLNGWVERNNAWDNRYGYRPVGVAREHLLLGLTSAIEEPILVESSTDWLKLISLGYQAIGTCGNRVFEQQARRILTLCKRITIIPQNDGPAIEWIKGVKKYLLNKIPVYIAKIPQEYKDICDYGVSNELVDKILKERTLLV